MMREILFRGKFGNEWKYGFLSIEPKGLVIKEPYKNESSNVWHIDADTVGQYTGMTDKNGKRIFEGDILKIKSYDYDYEYITQVYYSCHTLCVDIYGQDYDSTAIGFADDIWDEDCCEIEVIGNIYDNPELLKGENND